MFYIRHAEKSYSNGNSSEYSLDPNLTEKGRKMAEIKFKQLLDRYGIPNKIISSPYRRTRETSEIAQNVIFKYTGKSIDITYSPLIGEYLGHQTHRNINTSLHPDTLKLNPIPPENWREYGYRVRQHLQLIPNHFPKRPIKYKRNITQNNNIVTKHLVRINSNKKSEYIQNLQWNSLDEQKIDIYQNTTSNTNIVWFITHGIVIQSVAFFKGKKINYPSELKGIIVDGNYIYNI